jgi:hypothetical protein
MMFGPQRLLHSDVSGAPRVGVLTAKLVVIFDRYRNQYTHPVPRAKKSFAFKGFHIRIRAA